MVTAKFTLTFPDGQTVVAEIQAETPDREEPVKYTGAVERLPEKFETADERVLRAWAAGMARETGATVTENVEGQYDSWAE
jgi:hypothetical protein